MQKNKKAATVDEYLAQLPPQQKNTLEILRNAIMKAAPGAGECISYGIPMFKWQGYLAGIGAFKNHCSFFPTSYAVLNEVKTELSSYKVSKGTIQFPIDQPLPDQLVKKMIQAKIKENERKVNRTKNR